VASKKEVGGKKIVESSFIERVPKREKGVWKNHVTCYGGQLLKRRGREGPGEGV